MAGDGAQRALARQLGVQESALSEWLSGRRGVPKRYRHVVHAEPVRATVLQRQLWEAVEKVAAVYQTSTREALGVEAFAELADTGKVLLRCARSLARQGGGRDGGG